eukprot:TRINITY_DN34633_c0_g1_i1.p1 TRINITY_DN34633_c0_g1~~TRINITY_DN34633_c0_g1_i1.p1  ORF type:complete len:123 (-),score=7.36 TRINITY_DN34633_c0_g1_i1:124-492(-)
MVLFQKRPLCLRPYITVSPRERIKDGARSAGRMGGGGGTRGDGPSLSSLRYCVLLPRLCLLRVLTKARSSGKCSISRSVADLDLDMVVATAVVGEYVVVLVVVIVVVGLLCALVLVSLATRR